MSDLARDPGPGPVGAAPANSPGSAGRSGGETLAVHAPYDGILVARLPAADGGEVERALATAHGLFRDRDRWLFPARRIAILDGCALEHGGGSRLRATCRLD